MYDWYDKIHPHVKVPIGVTLRAQVSHNLMYRWLLSIHPGCFVSGHVPWSQTTDQILKQLGFKHVIIVRDPKGRFNFLCSSCNETRTPIKR